MSENRDRPVDENAKRPLVSFVLFAYNQERYIVEAVEAALAQTYSPLEIIISDDCSSDDTFSMIEQMTAGYRGPHTLVIRKNDNNLGLAAHINQVMTLVRGELVVVAAGDDVSFPHRVQTIASYWLNAGKASGSIFSRYQKIDEDGKITRHSDTTTINRIFLADRLEKNVMEISVGTSGCTQAWTRDVFDIFGPIDPRILHEDITIPLRSLLIGSVNWLPEELVMYRITTGSLSRIAFSDHRERFKKMTRYWEGRVANYEQFDRDLVRLKLEKHTSRPELDWLAQIVKGQADLAELNYRFFSGSFAEQVRAIFDRSISTGISRRLKLLVLTLLPSLYRFSLKT